MEVASRFRSHDFSDAFISLQLTGANDGIDSGGEETEELDRFPGHLIVTQSPYFQTQVDFARAQQEQQCGIDSNASSIDPAAEPAELSRASKRRRVESAAGNQSQQTRDVDKPILVVTIDEAAHRTAAVAVIGALYGVRDALSSLQAAELVYAVTYADMLQVDAAAGMAVDLLNL
eukprot:GHUV01020102.1.p1 GENE.GHUV01020102.1~~GHUV01020102.1.p1  ORF type:complete len:175 (+),score=61.18 GHUV01020102.1:2085-2609(+)